MLADSHGLSIHLGGAKVQHSAPLTRSSSRKRPVSPSTRRCGRRWIRVAVAAAESVGYVNAGTIEFLLTARTTEYYFRDEHFRLQVEHQ